MQLFSINRLVYLVFGHIKWNFNEFQASNGNACARVGPTLSLDHIKNRNQCGQSMRTLSLRTTCPNSIHAHIHSVNIGDPFTDG